MGAAALGAAVAGKVIYDAVTDEGSSSSSSSSTSSSTSGPSREEVQQQELESIYQDFQKEFREFWQGEDQLLCLKGQIGLSLCEKLPDLTRQNCISPDNAFVKLKELEKEKSCIKEITLINIAQLLSEKFSTCSRMTELVNAALPWDMYAAGGTAFPGAIFAASGTVAAPLLNNIMNNIIVNTVQEAELLEKPVNPDAPPRIAFADHYELCRDEGTLSSLFAACSTERTEVLDSLPENWQRLTPELSHCWKEVQNLEAATADGNEPRVVVCGMLKAGKSSLLNSLFDDRTNQHFPTARSRKTLKNQSEVRNGIRFIDTPGLDYNEKDTEEAHNAYAGADLLLFVHEGTKELEEIQLAFLQELQAMHADLEKKLLFVITSKEESGNELDALKAQISGKIRQRCDFSPEIFAVENTSYRSGKEQVRASSGIPELRSVIENRCRSIGDRLAEQREERRSKAIDALKAALEAVAMPIRQDRKNLEKCHSRIRKSFAQMVKDKKALVDEVQA